MARTKTTAKKVQQATGGKSPRKMSGEKSPRTQPAKSPRTQPAKSPRKTKASKVASEGVKKQYRHKPGSVVNREIKKLQSSTDPVCRKQPFVKLVRSLVHASDIAGIKDIENLRFQAKALEVLQSITESTFTTMFHNAAMLVAHNGKLTVDQNDIDLCLQIKKC